MEDIFGGRVRGGMGGPMGGGVVGSRLIHRPHMRVVEGSLHEFWSGRYGVPIRGARHGRLRWSWFRAPTAAACSSAY